MSKKASWFERYLTKEIGIEFKACLYFFALLFYYCTYRVVIGIYSASILHMAEMIFTTYIMGYIQVYLLWNFDEADQFGGKEGLGMLICTALYTIVSYGGGWFARNLWLTVGFAAYVVFVYICVFLIYKIRRQIDNKILNDELSIFQARNNTSKRT